MNRNEYQPSPDAPCITNDGYFVTQQHHHHQRRRSVSASPDIFGGSPPVHQMQQQNQMQSQDYNGSSSSDQRSQSDFIAAELRRMQQAREEEGSALMQLISRQQQMGGGAPSNNPPGPSFDGMMNPSGNSAGFFGSSQVNGHSDIMSSMNGAQQDMTMNMNGCMSSATGNDLGGMNTNIASFMSSSFMSGRDMNPMNHQQAYNQASSAATPVSSSASSSGTHLQGLNSHYHQQHQQQMGNNNNFASSFMNNGQGNDMMDRQYLQASNNMNNFRSNGFSDLSSMSMEPLPISTTASTSSSFPSSAASATAPSSARLSSEVQGQLASSQMQQPRGVGPTHSQEDPGWEEQYKALRAYHLQFGNCKVPARFKGNPKLGRWVMTQRRQFTLLMQGFPSALTAERIRRLESLGFTWSVRPEPVTTWNKKYQELKVYRATYGNCMVPQRYQANPQLGTWVHTQRRQYKLMAEGKKSSMTREKADALEAIGFFWAAKHQLGGAAAPSTGDESAACDGDGTVMQAEAPSGLMQFEDNDDDDDGTGGSVGSA